MTPRLGEPTQEGGFPAAELSPQIGGSEDGTGRGRGLFYASTAPRFKKVCPEETQIWGSCGGTRCTSPGKRVGATTRHPRALTCAGCLGRLWPTRPLRCTARLLLGSTRGSARLGPGPSPSPRAPHASPLAGAAPQMRLREEEPRGPGSPRARARGGGGGRGDVRGGGGRAAAPKTRHGSRHQPGAGAGVG